MQKIVKNALTVQWPYPVYVSMVENEFGIIDVESNPIYVSFISI